MHVKISQRNIFCKLLETLLEGTKSWLFCQVCWQSPGQHSRAWNISMGITTQSARQPVPTLQTKNKHHFRAKSQTAESNRRSPNVSIICWTHLFGLNHGHVRCTVSKNGSWWWFIKETVDHIPPLKYSSEQGWEAVNTRFLTILSIKPLMQLNGFGNRN